MLNPMTVEFFENLEKCKLLREAQREQWAEEGRRDAAAREANQAKKIRVLSRPITAEDIETQLKHLYYVPYAGSLCWMYYTRARGGVSGEYGRFKFYTDGEYCWVGAHQFALALKLGKYKIGECRLSGLFGFDAAHVSKAKCLGGRCCNPDHLRKRTSEQNRSWDRAKDYSLDGVKGYRTDEQLRQMISRLQLPTGPSPQPLPDFMQIL